MEYIFGHLKSIQQDKSYDKKVRKSAAKLYADLTNYDDFLFFFYYQEITARMAYTAKLLQYPDLQLFDVTRYITLLRIHLQKKYPKGSHNPVELLAHGYADQVTKDLFDGDMNSIIPLMFLILDIEDMEAVLMALAIPIEEEETPSLPTTTVRSTRHVDISSSYSSLLSKKSCKAKEQEVADQDQIVPEVPVHKVLFSVH